MLLLFLLLWFSFELWPLASVYVSLSSMKAVCETAPSSIRGSKTEFPGGREEVLFTAVLGVVGAGKSLPLDLRPHTCDAGLVEWAGRRTVSPLSSVPAVQKILMGWRVGPPSSRDTEGKARREPTVMVVCVRCEWIAVFPASFSVRADGREIQPPDLLGQREQRGWHVLGVTSHGT